MCAWLGASGRGGRSQGPPVNTNPACQGSTSPQGRPQSSTVPSLTPQGADLPAQGSGWRIFQTRVRYLNKGGKGRERFSRSWLFKASPSDLKKNNISWELIRNAESRALPPNFQNPKPHSNKTACDSCSRRVEVRKHRSWPLRLTPWPHLGEETHLPRTGVTPVQWSNRYACNVHYSLMVSIQL